MATFPLTVIRIPGDQRYWLLIRGATDPPKDANPVKRKGNGDYLKGCSQDMANMEGLINLNSAHHLSNVISNMVSLKKKDVIEAIIKHCKDTKQSGKKHNYDTVLVIYYTGHGQKDTGNWCCSDGVISLKEVINIIRTHWGNNYFSIFGDCCYSGNWVFQFKEYEGKVNMCRIWAASYPNCQAYDSSRGGYFTQMLVFDDDLIYKKDKKYKQICTAQMYGWKYNIAYYMENIDFFNCHY